MPRKRNKLNIIFHLVLAIELAAFQFAWPMSVARAEENPPAPPKEEQTKEKESDSESSNESNQNDEKTDKENNEENTESESNNNETGSEDENTDKKDANAESAESSDVKDESDKDKEKQEDPKNIWKNCDLDGLFDELDDEDDGDKCKKKESCGDIKICLKARIEIENDADIDNEVETEANTGRNELNLDQERPVREPRAGTGDSATDAACDDQKTEGEQCSEEDEAGGEEEKDDPDGEENSDSEKDILGEETASETENEAQAEAQIDTGDAAAVSDVVNEVNTTVVGSNGMESVENIYGDYEGDINLLDSFNSLLENGKNLKGENQSAFDAVEISVENEADIENDVATIANTGENEIDNEKENSSSSITTGDAVAAANVVNIVNNTIIGSNWLFTVINVFGNWVGDLIVPGEGLLTVPANGSQPENYVVEVENETDIENNIETSATTGENEIDSEGGSSSIETGDAVADNTVVNQVNSTVIADNWFFLAINNMGSWAGNIVNWSEETGAYDTVFSFDFEEEFDSEEGFVSWFTKIFIKNDANIENNVATSANTGGNEIESEGGSAQIKTGNAYASSKVYNLVNNNFIGNNWMFAVVNIFGSWNGNVEFAYPDLAVDLGASVDRAKAGDSYSYSLSVANEGGAGSDDLNVGLDLPEGVEYLGDTSGASSSCSSGNCVWNFSGMKPGEAKSFDVRVSVSSGISSDAGVLESRALVGTYTKEVELSNNSASDQVTIYDVKIEEGDDGTGGEGSAGVESVNVNLSASRKADKKKVEIGKVNEHTIKVRNNTGKVLNDVVVQDKIQNKEGGAGAYEWDVGKLDSGKTATISYKIVVNPGSPAGDYRHTSVAWGYDDLGNKIISNEAGITIDVDKPDLAEEEGEYYYLYYFYDQYGAGAPTSLVESEAGIIPAAEAAGEDQEGQVLGAWTNGVCQTLPWWGWIAAGIIYLATVHWSLLRQSGAVEPVKIKKD